MWVADYGNHRIQLMGSDGLWRVAGGKAGDGAGTEGRGAGEFRYPSGIAVDGNGVVWVADSFNHRIQSKGSDGRWRVAGGKPGGGEGAIGSGAGEFRFPSGIAVDGNGVVWVADFGNHRIQSMGSDGRWRVAGGKPGGPGRGAGEFNVPNGIAVDGNGVVWVADSGNHRIQSMGSDGLWRVTGGKAVDVEGAHGSGAGEFSAPSGIAVDGNGVVWVAEFGNHRIQSMLSREAGGPDRHGGRDAIYAALIKYAIKYLPSHPVGWVVGTSMGIRIGMRAAEGFAQVSCGA